MLIAIQLVKRYWKVAAMLLLLLVAYMKGAGDKDAAWEARWLSRDKAEAVAALKATNVAREQEQKWAAAFDAAAAISHEEMTNVQNHRDRLLADLRSGRVSFKPARCPVPEAAADSGQPAQGEEGRQPGLAGEELVSRLAACDEVTVERNLAVELLKSERR